MPSVRSISSTAIRARCMATAGLLSCVLASSASAQTVDVVPSLRPGDEFRLQIVHTREDSTRPQRNATITTPVQLRVLAVRDEGTTIEWQPEKASSDNPAAANDPLVRAAADAAGNVALRISLSPDGEVTGLANEKEVLAKLQAGVDVMLRALVAQVPPEQRAQLQSAIAGVLSPQVLIASAMRDVESYFSLGGASLDVGEELEVAMQQPNPFGGDPLPGALWVKAESATAEAVVIRTRTSYDKDALITLAKSVIAQAGAAPLSSGDLAPSMEMVDEARFVIDRRFGIAREIDVNRGVMIGQQRRLERWTFRLVELPKR